MTIDQQAVRAVMLERLRILGCSGVEDEESDDPVPEFFKVPGLRLVFSRGSRGGSSSNGGEKWEGTRHARKVTVWRGSKWFRLSSDIRVSGPAPRVEVKGRDGRWEGRKGAASPVLAANPPDPGSVRLESGPDGVHVRRRISTRDFFTPEGSSMHWADLILAEQLAAVGTH